ncbi:MAG: DUF547 domain-containing protein [Deltaproteobacteria bacterium]|nr:DUF547 domain-containing protein [Deltaproteobacteria bacterium]
MPEHPILVTFEARLQGTQLRTFALTLTAIALVAASAHAESLDEALYARILSKYTRDVPDTARVRVDYSALKHSDEWPHLLTNLAHANLTALPSREERLAFWINAYNILAIQVVLDHYPIDDIREAGSLIRPVWKRTAGVIGGRSVSLGWIEHEVLRPMGEPRIHGAIVCASVSCPALNREPFSAVRLDADLDDAMQRLLTDPDKGLQVDRDDNKLRLSQIFKWFRDDFDAHGGVLGVVARYATPEARRWLERHPEPRLRYLDYDWRLNDVARAP